MSLMLENRGKSRTRKRMLSRIRFLFCAADPTGLPNWRSDFILDHFEPAIPTVFDPNSEECEPSH